MFVLAVTAATLAQIGFFMVGPGTPAAAPKPARSASPTPSATATAPPPSAAENRTWSGSLTLNTVRLGITLDGKQAPHAVANFVGLVKRGFYDGLSCHRLTTGAAKVLQCGDPKGDGTGGPGYAFGPIENAPKNDVYPAGTIAMARASGNPNSQGSQFFLVYGTTTFPKDADGYRYTVFGHVTSGLPALRSAVTSKGVSGGGDDGAPNVKTTIQAVTVR